MLSMPIVQRRCVACPSRAASLVPSAASAGRRVASYSTHHTRRDRPARRPVAERWVPCRRRYSAVGMSSSPREVGCHCDGRCVAMSQQRHHNNPTSRFSARPYPPVGFSRPVHAPGLSRGAKPALRMSSILEFSRLQPDFSPASAPPRATNPLDTSPRRQSPPTLSPARAPSLSTAKNPPA